jgi:DNA-binding CsgD family transcriptional regulator
LSAEVVDYVGIWPAVAPLVGPLHDHAREPGLVTACQQPAVGVVASDVYACDDSIEAAHPSELFTRVQESLLIRAYGLSEREIDVVQGVLQGLSTAEIGHATYLSPYTVQDYLGSVFQKVGVRSRRELMSKVFAEYHWPRYGDGDAKLGPDGWFAELRSAASSA